MIKAGEHYLIPCKKLALRTIKVRNGSENKMTTKNLSIFQCIFSFFMYFEISKTVVNWTLKSNVVLFEK